MSSHPGPAPIHDIAPSAAWVPIQPAEVWAYRELLYFLIWREIKVRYKQTALGVAWAIVQPLFTMVVFTIVFGRFARIDTGTLPYPIFAYVALLPWQLFAFALSESSNSVVANQRLLTKVYFPRIVLPLASVSVGLVDFCAGGVVLLALLLAYGITPGFALLTVPLWAMLAALTALAFSLWLSALNVRYRDIRYTLPFLTQIWLMATPVAYPSTLVPEAWRPVYALNPMVGVVEGFRWAVAGGEAPGAFVFVSLAVVLLILVSGVFYFRKMERTFADVV